MIESVFKEYLLERIRREYLMGDRGAATIPPDDLVNQEIEKQLAKRSDLFGDVSSFEYKGVSDPDSYVNNFKTIKDNIELSMGEISELINEIIDTINDSTIEKNSAIREIKKITSSFQEVEAGRLKNNLLSYTINESFSDLDQIDVLNSTAEINLNAGKVSLSSKNSDRLQFPHYLNQTKQPFNIVEGRSSIIGEEMVPGTRFGAMFSPDETDRWEYIITTSDSVRVAGYFNLKLSEIGNAVDINNVVIKLGSSYTSNPDNPNGLIRLEYLVDGVWKNIPGAISEINSKEVSFDFASVKTTYLRVYFIKDWPDDPSENKYYFSVEAIIVRKTNTSFESILRTRPISVTSYQNEEPSIYSVMLKSNDQLKEGTKIEYYVAIDDPIAGKILNAAGDIVDIDSDEAAEFVPNGLNANDDNENYYSYASELKNHPWISGAALFSDWEPTWQKISPTNFKDAKVSKRIFFNITQKKNDCHDISFVDPYYFGDPRYPGPWPVDASTTWEDAWDGTSEGSAKSGFIWGENPTTLAGVWWGDGVEYPGWWRPAIPDMSGTYVTPTTYSYSDFHVNGMDFWKIFKWPSEFAPIPGTIQLFVSDYVPYTETNGYITGKNSWKWSIKGTSTAVPKYEYQFKLDQPYVTLKLNGEDGIFPSNQIGMSFVKDSFAEFKFVDFNPSEITEFIIDFGYAYTKKDDGTYQRSDTFEEGVATIIASEPLRTYQKVTGKPSALVSIKFDYVAKKYEETCWESFFYVPEGLTEAKAKINDNGFINKIELLNLDDYGITIDSKTWDMTSSTNNILEIPLPTEWCKIKVFVDIDYFASEEKHMDGSSAKWKPNEYQIDESTTEFSIVKTPTTADKTTVIQDTDVSFTASGVMPGVHVEIWDGDQMSLATITKVDMNELSITQEAATPLKVERYRLRKFNIVNNFESYSAQSVSNIRSMKQVDLYTLMYETENTDDSRFAIIRDIDGDQYAVVKTPNQQNFPSFLMNYSHFTRTIYDSSVEGGYVTYTTGTDKNVNGHPHPVTKDDESVDLSDRPPNTFNNKTYSNISTYGRRIQVWNPLSSSFLFWDTAENLQTYYRISYALPTANRPSKKILLMAKLISDRPETTPVVNGFSLIINSEEDFGEYET